jgi:hypothetical protein
MLLEERVKLVTEDDMGWDWNESNPVFYNKTPQSSWGRHIKFDPFPCYSHKKDLVTDIAKQVEKSFPIGFNVFYFIYPNEPLERTNGTASKNTVSYEDEENRKKAVWEGTIDLYGKRIPLHPAMTRYLVSHEYGHIVDNWINHCRGLKEDGFDKEYAKMRGIELDSKYGGRRWHSNIGEIIANDFRICVTGFEKEFWPHDCKHPDEDDNVKNWWYEAMISFSK